MALFCGGLAQLLAGMWEFPRGNVFGGTGELTSPISFTGRRGRQGGSSIASKNLVVANLSATFPSAECHPSHSTADAISHDDFDYMYRDNSNLQVLALISFFPCHSFNFKPLTPNTNSFHFLWSILDVICYYPHPREWNRRFVRRREGIPEWCRYFSDRLVYGHPIPTVNFFLLFSPPFV